MSEPRKPFTVANMRPRRTLNVFGRTLAPRGHGRNSECDLTEPQLLACLRKFQQSRLELVRGDMPASMAKALAPEDEPEAVPVVEAVPEPPVVEDEPKAVVEPVVDLSDVVEPHHAVWTAEALAELNYADLKALAKSQGISTAGKRTLIAERLLEAQAS